MASNVLGNGSDKSILRFKVTANNNDVGIFKYTATIATTGPATLKVTSVNVHCFTDSLFSQGCSGVNPDGQLDVADAGPDSNGVVEIYAENTGSTRTPIQVPTGSTYYFEVRGTIANSDGSDSITTTLEGDAAYGALFNLMSTSTGMDLDTNDDFIWSPNATGTSDIAGTDWTNGYSVPGLPSTGLSDVISN